MRKLSFTLCLGMALGLSTARPAEVTIGSLLREMADRSVLARYPAPEYRTRQAGSYDRASVQPGEASWFANWDRSQFLRTDSVQGRREFVLLDADGPGAVVRFWATVADYGGQGTLRMYFDHDTVPAIEGEVLSLLSGGALAPAPLSASVSELTPYLQRGHNLYLPLPYARHCKITYESPSIREPGKNSGECFYYNINYRTYAPDTQVKTFARADLDACRALVDSVCAQLVSSGGCAGGKEAANIRTFASAGGQSLRLLGPGAVCRLSVRLRADDLEQALRSTVLRMAFDGRETVWVPVGDFFGTGNRLKPYGTYFTSVSADTVLTCRWVMPYREDCRIALENVRGDRVQASLEADVCPWQWDDRSMYFGAGWTEYNRLYTGATRDMEGTLAQRDVNFVSLRGRGVYVGDALTVFNTVADWWGEGDEKVYVDGESFPSHFGTGTEDYYGYAWCMYPPFAQPFIAQPDGSGDTQPGHVANLRFRSLDAIPFGSSLVFDMELWHWASTYVNYAPTTFWYMLPGGTSNRGENIPEAAAPVARHKNDLVPCTLDSAGTVEGEFMDIRLTGGEERSQSMAHMGWSNGAQFFWRGGVSGDTARLGFRVERGGWYDLTVCATQAPDYGCFAVSLGGAEQTVDLYAPTLGTCRWSLGRVRLQPGMNWLVFRQLPKNPASTNNLLGIDRIVVRKTPRPM